jgi:general secretion pathway protein E
MKASEHRAEPTAGEDGERRAEALARRYGVEVLPAVADDMLAADLIVDVPVEWARANVLLPIRVNGQVRALCADPGAVDAHQALALLIGLDAPPVVAARERVLQAIERCYLSRDSSPTDFLREMEPQPAPAEGERTSKDDLLRVAEEAPVTQLVNLVLLEAVKKRASDIHIEPFENRLVVRYRIDGALYEQAAPPKRMEAALVSRIKVMARMDIAEKRLPQDGMARVAVGEREIDIRVSTVPVAEGERVVLRLLDRSSTLLPMESLGMPADVRERFDRLLAEPNGIVVVSGPTGSGKTTTLYAALAQLDARRNNIMTIEDPIEYQLPGIGQIQVKPKIGLTFASGLRHILRQDPDIVLVGETRDLETADIAVRASLTGHLVFTTLHTNDAPSAALRLLDIGVEPYLLASCLRGVLAQRLARVLCAECKGQGLASVAECERLGPAGRRLIGRMIGAPVGCPLCLEGYRGRTGFFELAVADEAMRVGIRAGRGDLSELRRAALAGGMRPLQEVGVDKVLAGITSLAEVMAVAG